MDDISSPLPQPKKQKALSLEDILLQLGPITDVSYEPFKCETSQPAQALLPASFPRNPYPFDYFSLFFTRDLFQTITTNTNRYASKQRLHITKERARQWTDLLMEELYVFVGTMIYMGVHEEPRVEMYWNTDFNTGPLHSITSHISIHRFQQIKRYCHISCPESDERAGYYLPSNEKWWYKLEPLASSIQASSRRYYSPSSEVSIDELMVRCFGRYASLFPFSYPATPLIILDLYIRTRCQRNRLSKGIRSMGLRITDTYITGCGAPGRRDIKIWSFVQDSLLLAVSYDTLHSLCHADSLRYISIITLHLFPCSKNYELVISALLALQGHIRNFLTFWQSLRIGLLKSWNGTLSLQ